jgi:hypothetical protein
MEELSSKEQAPVVFDASLNFVLGIDKQRVRQSFKPTASHQEPQTASSYLSTKISNFLQRTDHIMDEWKRIGRGGNEDANVAVGLGNGGAMPARRSLSRTKSATNIMIKGYRYFSKSSSACKSPSRTLSSMSDDDKTLSQCDEEVVDEQEETHSRQPSPSSLSKALSTLCLCLDYLLKGLAIVALFCANSAFILYFLLFFSHISRQATFLQLAVKLCTYVFIHTFASFYVCLSASASAQIGVCVCVYVCVMRT